MRDDQQSLYLPEGGGLGGCRTLELVCEHTNDRGKTATVEKLHAIVNEIKVSMENVAIEVAELSAQVSRLREEVSKADLICYEETATNEEAIKDVQDAQSNLTQASQILMYFFAKAGQAVYLTQQSLLSEAWAIEGLTTEIRWEVLTSLAPYMRF